MESRPAKNYLFKPFFGSSHWWALNILDTLPRTHSILDVGSGRGALGEVLKDKGFSDLAAIEIDEGARKEATAHYGEVVPTPTDLPDRTFDVILLLDVLEHVADPKGFLDEVLRSTHRGSIVLISVPNVAHWSLRFALLFGFFEYTSRGLLDETHLSFFTRRRLKRLVGGVSTTRDPHWGVSIAPLEFLLPDSLGRSAVFLAFSRLRLTLARLFPGLLAYQHLVYLETQGAVANQKPRPQRAVVPPTVACC